MRHSIYTSAYNLISMRFDWQATLTNWQRFLGPGGQIVIAVNTSTDDTLKALQDYALAHPGNWIIFPTDIPYTDPLFDGLIKNEALRRCKGDFCTLLDMDEVLPLSNRAAWDKAMEILGSTGYDALFLPVIDLFHDDKSYKALGQKWYLHKNRPYLKRGRVAFAARADGTTDITKSDTCELIQTNGSLANAAHLNVLSFDEDYRLLHMRGNLIAYVVHTGWLNKQQRLRQSAFWAPVWNARDGSTVEKPLELADLDKIPHKLHGLKHWNEE